ncbi:glycoside hydrolase family 113 [Schumannella luteola]
MTEVPFQRGMSYGYRGGRGGYALADVERDAAEMASWGIDSVALHVHLAQETFASTRLFADIRATASDEELVAAIGAFRSHGIRVMLKPMVESQDSAWQGSIRFPDDGNEQIAGIRTAYWAAWFASFTEWLAHYARLAERSGVEVFCVGCELVGTMDQSALWTTAIQAVRAEFSGAVTYNTDHSALHAPRDWFQGLDLLSISYYVSVASGPGESVEQMRATLAPLADELGEQAEALGMPVIFGEIGARSRVGTATLPWDYQTRAPYSGQEQADYLEAILSTFWERPWWRGLYWWKWEERQSRPLYREDPAGDTGFTLQGKPGQGTLSSWYRGAGR